ncbi:MAG TPA: twin-arginine translocase subunit TatC [Paludibacteraceae bacterium]|nr:twin-arginine translocase subunit TatC [Paludibacteraceae bacterium]HPT43211.1 twin-arginine translocase subunit TatC [Paludibacteraceae bacterium]
MGKPDSEKEFTFWEHLEALRWTILRSLGVVTVLTFVFFGFKDFVFSKIILPPLNSDFYTYRLLCLLSEKLKMPGLCPDDFSVQLININLAGQFITHITSSLIMAVVLSMPYLLFEIWRFINPALYEHERKNISIIFLSSSFLFYLGALVSYFLIFPLTIRFLGTYQVSGLVTNQISIQSYMNALGILIFSLGIMFELPIVIYALNRIGLVSKKALKSFRKYAFVGILIIAAVITPTTDPFTMLVVALPIYLLYEVSILLCNKDLPALESDSEEED